MSYRLEPHESVPEGVRRIALEQLGKAQAELDDDAMDHHETIHQVRKRCKKLRGLVRLVRPRVPDLYDHENTTFRDAARLLSDLRDATALLETYDLVMDHYADEVDRRAFGPIRGALTRRRNRLTDEMDLPERLERFRAVIEAAPERVRGWSIPDDGYATVRGGLRKTYKRGRRALTQAYEEPSDEQFHEWRKRVKYHWYHVRLLRPLWKPMLQKRRKQLKLLSDDLGDDHDLAVFKQALLGEPETFERFDQLQALLGLVDRRRGELQAHARPLGLRLFAEPKDALADRFGGFWDAWTLEQTRSTELAAPHAR